jgi:Ca2+:H+ antiporter
MSATATATVHKPSCTVRLCRRLCCCYRGCFSGPLGLRAFLFTKLNVFAFVCGPLAFVSESQHWGEGPTLTLAMVAIMPLAERLGYLTEQMAMHTNDTLGGLLNATLGNAVETLISIMAIVKAKQARDLGNNEEGAFFLTLVQTSLLGSMLSNLLLVQGSALFAGGLRYPVQKFNRDGAITSAGLLVLCTLGLGVPTMLWSSHDGLTPTDKQLALSRFVSGSLLFIYFCFLVFQLKTHRFLFESAGSNTLHQAKIEAGLEFSAAPVVDDLGDVELSRNGADARHAHPSPEDARSTDDLVSDAGSEPGGHLDRDELHEPDMGFLPALMWLTLSTVCIAFISHIVVDAAEGAVEGLGVSSLFMGGIVIPVVGNAAEHASALVFAWRNKLDISLGVAVGSAIQIPLFVMPLCVLVSWAMVVPLTLNLPLYFLGIVIITCLAVSLTLHAGKSTWLTGLMMIVEYVIIAASFWLADS